MDQTMGFKADLLRLDKECLRLRQSHCHMAPKPKRVSHSLEKSLALYGGQQTMSSSASLSSTRLGTPSSRSASPAAGLGAWKAPS